MKVLVALGFFLAASVPAAELTGAKLRAALIGGWCNSEDNGRTCWAYDKFFPDGTFRACGRNTDDHSYFEGTGNFEINGRRMCYVVTTATESFWIRPGTSFCTDILSIDSVTHEYQDIESLKRHVLYRRPIKQLICKPAK